MLVWYGTENIVNIKKGLFIKKIPDFAVPIPIKLFQIK